MSINIIAFIPSYPASYNHPHHKGIIRLGPGFIQGGGGISVFSK